MGLEQEEAYRRNKKVSKMKDGMAYERDTHARIPLWSPLTF